MQSQIGTTSNKSKPLRKGIAILLLLITGILSVVVSSAGVRYGALELGALIYFFVIALVSIAAIILFILLATYKVINRIRWVTILSIIILLTGLFMRLDFYYNIFNW